LFYFISLYIRCTDGLTGSRLVAVSLSWFAVNAATVSCVGATRRCQRRRAATEFDRSSRCRRAATKRHCRRQPVDALQPFHRHTGRRTVSRPNNDRNLYGISRTGGRGIFSPCIQCLHCCKGHQLSLYGEWGNWRYQKSNALEPITKKFHMGDTVSNVTPHAKNENEIDRPSDICALWRCSDADCYGAGLDDVAQPDN